MIKVILKIKYTDPDGYTAWLEARREERAVWTPLRGFYDTPEEAADRAIEDLPGFLKELKETPREDA